MTKKSHARLERDKLNKAEQFQEAPPWDALKNLYQVQMQSLAEIERQVSKFFQIEGVASFIPAEDKTKTVVQMKSLGSEITYFRGELAKVYAVHSERSGKLVAGEHLVDIIRTSEAYTDIGMRIEAIVTPIYHYLLSVMGEVERRAHEAANQSAKQTPEPAAV